MAKSTLLSVLESTIGKYVKNLDAESLDVGIWNGKVELQNLELNIEYLNRELECMGNEDPTRAVPFRFIGGSFENLELEVPWTRISSKPVVIRARGLKAFVGLHTCHSPNLLKSRIVQSQKAREERAQTIDSFEAARVRANAIYKLSSEIKEENATKKKSSSFMDQMVTRIVENLHIEISDVHVYLQGFENSVGCVLERFSVSALDSEALATFTERNKDEGAGDGKSFVHKSLEIKNFGFYLDDTSSDSDSRGSLKPTDSEGDLSRGSSVGRRPAYAPQHSYILSPISFEANLRRSLLSSMDFEVDVQSRLSDVEIYLSKPQLEAAYAMSALIASFNPKEKPLFPQYRPLEPINKDTAHEWWKYAFRCVSRLNGKRGWNEFLIALRKREAYIPLYMRWAHHEECGWLHPLSDEELEKLKAMEQDRTISIEGVMLWRNVADARVELEIEKRRGETNVLDLVFGTSRNFEIDDSEDNEEQQSGEKLGLGTLSSLSAEEMKASERIGLAETKSMAQQKFSWKCCLSFKLDSFLLSLMSWDLRPIAELEVGVVSLACDASSDGSLTVSYKMSSMTILDLSSRTLYPTILNAIKEDDESDGEAWYVLSMKYGQTPSGSRSAYLKFAALEIVASPQLVVELSQFAKPAASSTSQASETSASEASASEASAKQTKKTTTSRRTQNAMIEAWNAKLKEKQEWSIELKVRAPILVVPEDSISLSANVLVLDFGNFRFAHGDSVKKRRAHDWFAKQPRRSAEENSFEVTAVSLKRLSCRITTTELFAATSTILDDDQAFDKNSIFIEPFSGRLDIGIEKVSVSQVPRMCALGGFRSLCFRMSPPELKGAISIAASWQELANRLQSGGNSKRRSTLEASRVSEETSDDVKEGPPTAPTVIGGTPPAKLVNFQADLSFERISLYVLTNDVDSVEAHLGLVSIKSSTFASGTRRRSFSFGLVWFFDGVDPTRERYYRLFFHSRFRTLPDNVSLTTSDEILKDVGRIFGSAASAEADYCADFVQTLKNEAEERVGDYLFTRSSTDYSHVVINNVIEAETGHFSVHYNRRAINIMLEKLWSLEAEIMQFYRDSMGKTRNDENQAADEATIANEPAESERPESRTTALRLFNVQMKTMRFCLLSPSDEIVCISLFTRVSVGMLSAMSGRARRSTTADIGDLLVTAEQPGSGKQVKIVRHLPGRRQSLISTRYTSVQKPMSEGRSNLETRTSVNCGPQEIVVVPEIVHAILLASSSASASSTKDAKEPSAVKDAPDVKLQGLTRTSTLEFSCESSRMVVFDADPSELGSFQPRSTRGALKDCVVVQSEAKYKKTTVSDSIGSTFAIDTEGTCNRMEIYIAQGRQLLNPTQLLEPTSFFARRRQEKGTDGSTSTDVFLDLRTNMDVTISFHDAGVMSTIMGNMAEAMTTESDQEGRIIAPETAEVQGSSGEQSPATLDVSRELKVIEELASVIWCETFDSGPIHLDARANETGPAIAEVTLVEGSYECRYRSKLTCTGKNMSFTFVNDMQGIEVAVMRMRAEEVRGTWAVAALRPDATERVSTEASCDVSLTADYFDPTGNSWNPLLRQPWALKLSYSKRRMASDLVPPDIVPFSTNLVMESMLCDLSFSDHFLALLVDTKSAMSTYSTTRNSIETTINSQTQSRRGYNRSRRRSMAAQATRHFTTAQPYGVENHTGKDFYFEYESSIRSIAHRRLCQHGHVVYFRFEHLRGKGAGGKRRFGQDRQRSKSVTLFFKGRSITIRDIDEELGLPRSAHDVGSKQVVVTTVRWLGKRKVLHVGSHVDILNRTSIPFHISTRLRGESEELGTCEPHRLGAARLDSATPTNHSNFMGLPIELLGTMENQDASQATLLVCPILRGEARTNGEVQIPSIVDLLQRKGPKAYVQVVSCKSQEPETSDFQFNVVLRVDKVDDVHPFLEVAFHPRAIIENRLPLPVAIRTECGNAYWSESEHENEEESVLHRLEPSAKMEVFAAREAVDASINMVDIPDAGELVTWSKSVSLPLTVGHACEPEVECMLPFARRKKRRTVVGLCLTIMEPKLEGGEEISPTRVYQIIVPCHFVDHTQSILVEEVSNSARWKRGDSPSPAYENIKGERVSLLSASTSPVRLFFEDMKRQPCKEITVDDVNVCEGGVESTELVRADKSEMGICVYRRLLDSVRAEIHVIPEFIVYNGSSTYPVTVVEKGRRKIVRPQGILGMPRRAGDGLFVSLEYDEIGGKVEQIRVDKLKHQSVTVKSRDRIPLGRVYVNTVIGGLESRFVVELGEVLTGDSEALADRVPFECDDFRCRLTFSGFNLTLNQIEIGLINTPAIKSIASDQSVTGRMTTQALAIASWLAGPAVKPRRRRYYEKPVLTLSFTGWAIDLSGAFRGGVNKFDYGTATLSMIAKNFQVLDDAESAVFPVVFESSAEDVDFMNLSVNMFVPVKGNALHVDLVDIKVAQQDNIPDKLVFQTSESFLWRLLDVSREMRAASSGLSGKVVDLFWNEEEDCYEVLIKEKHNEADDLKHKPASVDIIFDVAKARVSPFGLVLTFKREPQIARYGSDGQTAGFLNFLKTKLKFTLKEAELHFGQYVTRNVKGPPSRLLSELSVVYKSRTKMKFLTLLSAIKFEGNEEAQEETTHTSSERTTVTTMHTPPKDETVARSPAGEAGTPAPGELEMEQTEPAKEANKDARPRSARSLWKMAFTATSTANTLVKSISGESSSSIVEQALNGGPRTETEQVAKPAASASSKKARSRWHVAYRAAGAAIQVGKPTFKTMSMDSSRPLKSAVKCVAKSILSGELDEGMQRVVAVDFTKSP